MKNKIFAALIAVLIPLAAHAFRLSPMVIHFSPQGNKSTQVLLLENQGTEKVPVQIEAFARSTDKNGEEVRVKSEDFIIYPEQLVLLPGEKRNVRVTWSGEFTGSDEKAYRIIASQLPVKFNEKGQASGNQDVNLNFLLQYVASAYVVPAGAKSKVRVKEVQAVDAKKIAVLVVNEGSAHQVLHTKDFTLYAGDKKVLQLKQVKEFENVNLLPKTERKIIISLPKEVPAQGLKADLTLAESTD